MMNWSKLQVRGRGQGYDFHPAVDPCLHSLGGGGGGGGGGGRRRSQAQAFPFSYATVWVTYLELRPNVITLLHNPLEEVKINKSICVL